jgi:hypothetical protein
MQVAGLKDATAHMIYVSASCCCCQQQHKQNHSSTAPVTGTECLSGMFAAIQG